MDNDLNLPVSLIIGLRNNLNYTIAFYNSVRQHYPNVEIVFVSFGSTDGTHKWLEDLEDKNVIYFASYESKTLSETYNKGVELSTRELICYMHNDMIVSKGFIEELVASRKNHRVSFYTVVEPPIFTSDTHDWKIVKDFGDIIEHFDYEKFNEFTIKRLSDENLKNFETRDPFFFLCMHRDENLRLGGLDPLFNPMFCEDSDLLLRLKLLEFEMIQLPRAIVYHFVSKTSRFSEEFLNKTQRIEENSVRNFYRKWSFAPGAKVFRRFDIGAIVMNGEAQEMIKIEPYVAKVYTDSNIENYIENEQKNTLYNLKNKFRSINQMEYHDVIITLDMGRMKVSDYENIKKLSEILEENYLGKKSFIRRFLFNRNNFRIGAISFKINVLLGREKELVQNYI